MTLTVELTPEQEARLTVAAQQEGLEPADLAQKLITEHLSESHPEAEPDPTLVLFEQWKQEDAQKTPEEVEQECRLWETFEQGINEARTAQEMRQL